MGFGEKFDEKEYVEQADPIQHCKEFVDTFSGSFEEAIITYCREQLLDNEALLTSLPKVLNVPAYVGSWKYDYYWDIEMRRMRYLLHNTSWFETGLNSSPQFQSFLSSNSAFANRGSLSPTQKIDMIFTNPQLMSDWLLEYGYVYLSSVGKRVSPFCEKVTDEFNVDMSTYRYFSRYFGPPVCVEDVEETVTMYFIESPVIDGNFFNKALGASSEYGVMYMNPLWYSHHLEKERPRELGALSPSVEVEYLGKKIVVDTYLVYTAFHEGVHRLNILYHDLGGADEIKVIDGKIISGPQAEEARAIFHETLYVGNITQQRFKQLQKFLLSGSTTLADIEGYITKEKPHGFGTFLLCKIIAEVCADSHNPHLTPFLEFFSGKGTAKGVFDAEETIFQGLFNELKNPAIKELFEQKILSYLDQLYDIR